MFFFVSEIFVPIICDVKLSVMLKPKLLKHALKFYVVNINVHHIHTSHIAVLNFR
jgi:hypothetical protein